MPWIYSIFFSVKTLIHLSSACYCTSLIKKYITGNGHSAIFPPCHCWFYGVETLKQDDELKAALVEQDLVRGLCFSLYIYIGFSWKFLQFLESWHHSIYIYITSVGQNNEGIWNLVLVLDGDWDSRFLRLSWIWKHLLNY